MNIPRAQGIGIELSGKKHAYKILSEHQIDDNLSVYKVRHNEETLEAQKFIKTRLPPNIYLSRKRRIQRLRSSGNFVEEIPVDGANIFISRMPRGGIARHVNLRQKARPIEETAEHCAIADDDDPIADDDFPELGSTDQAFSGKLHCDAWSGKTARSFAQVAVTAEAQTSQVTSPPNKSVHEHSRRALYPLANYNR